MNWIQIIALIVLGGVLIKIIELSVKKISSKLRGAAPIIRNYWIFVIVFLVTLAILYFLVFLWVSGDNLSVFTNVIGQISALIFAIFVGYFAFLQVVENRLGSILNESIHHVDVCNWGRAILLLEEYCATKTKDFYNLATLLELYIITNNYESYNKYIDNLSENIIDKSDELTFYYLEALKELMLEHISEAKEGISDLIKFRRENHDVVMNYWNFDDLKKSNVYKNLTIESEAKKMINNLIKYLQNSLPNEKRNDFEDGNFTLT